MTFTFELVFTGMCLLELDQESPTKCTVHLPDASRPNVVFKKVPKGRRPFRHVPCLSFPTKFQQDGGRSVMREVDRVFPAPDGEEIGVCDLKGETLTLEPRDPSPPLSLRTLKMEDPQEAPRVEELFDWASRLQDLVTLSNCTFTGINAAAVTTRVHLAHGELGTLECGRQNDGIVVYKYDTVRGSGVPKRGRSLSDAVVLRLQGLTKAVKLRSAAGDFFFFPPRPLPAREVVRVCISSFHEKPEDNRPGLFDFLWYYRALAELKSGSRKPDPLNLFVPYIPQDLLGGPVTGSTGHCPPTVVFPVTSGGRSSADRVTAGLTTVEGEETEEGEFPGLVALLDKDGELAGSGVLLDGDILLSAGHVLKERPTTIVLGRNVNTGKRLAIRADSFRRPDDYNQGGALEDDLLLCRLKDATSIGSRPRATASEIGSASKVTVAGFGFGGTRGPAGIQRKFEPNVLHAFCPAGDPSGCHAGKELVTDEQGVGNIFPRDSGCPAYVSSGGTLKLAAIASRTTSEEKGIYVRLDAHDPWIAETIKELKALRKPAA